MELFKSKNYEGIKNARIKKFFRKVKGFADYFVETEIKIVDSIF